MQGGWLASRVLRQAVENQQRGAKRSGILGPLTLLVVAGGVAAFALLAMIGIWWFVEVFPFALFVLGLVVYSVRAEP